MFVQRYKNKVFEWGKYDCAVLARDYIDYHSPGNDLIPVRGQYATKREAVAFNKQYQWIKTLDKSSFAIHARKVKPAYPYICIHAQPSIFKNNFESAYIYERELFWSFCAMERKLISIDPDLLLSIQGCNLYRLIDL